MDELPREKLTKSTKIVESIKTILIASKRRSCALHVPEEFSHIYLYCTTFYNRVPHEVGTFTFSSLRTQKGCWLLS